MTKKLLDLSGKIDDFTVAALETIARVAQSLSIPFFVVGATARDIILTYAYDIQTTRATQDIDFGVQVSDWGQYERLKEGLLGTGKFASTRDAQRLLYEHALRVDVIPFGPIAKRNNTIVWPPNNEIRMNILGFQEAYQNSVLVRLSSDPMLEMRFATPTGLALMKIISWSDRYPERDRDAKDLLLLMRNYIDAGNLERLYREETDLVETEDFDYDRASARVLGRDMAAVVLPRTKDALLEILDRETGEQDRYRLVEDMMKGGPVTSYDFDEILGLLEELKLGFLERLQG